jgi:hypothetical protein
MKPTENPDGSLTVPGSMYSADGLTMGDGEITLRPGDEMYDSWRDWIRIANSVPRKDS